MPISAVATSASAQEAPAPPAQPAAAPPPPTVTAQAAAVPIANLHATAMQVLANRHLYFARRHRQLLGDPLSLSERRRLRAELSKLTPARLRARTDELRGDIRSMRRKLERKRRARAVPPHLKAIAQCESGGNPRAVSAGGTYRGKYQFSYSTWRSVGGRGDPARASEAEQNRRAAKLYRTGGPGHWPVCGR
ncbi:MAG TPA: transglycosylase family protein [Solirubrobacteraceae bacterium]|nr:transglycosylase family protein [Solirubrobacteraceae bacterium]